MKKQSILRVFEIYRSNRSGQWGWRSKSTKNGKTTFSGESHPSASNALRAIKQELAALGATNPVSIEIVSGKKRSIVYHRPAPLINAADQLRELVGKPVKTLFIEDMGFSTRTLNVLKEEGFETAADITKYRKNELLKLPGMGARSFVDLLKVLKAHKLGLDEPTVFYACECGRVNGEHSLGTTCEFCQTHVKKVELPRPPGAGVPAKRSFPSHKESKLTAAQRRGR